MVIAERLDHLAVYKGLPVPWVATWEAEKVGPVLGRAEHGLVVLDGHKFTDHAWGMLLLSGLTRREGEPDFGSTHSWRQRRCMQRRLCQVCGFRREPMLWVIPNAGHHPALWEQGLVLNAPVCEPCYDAARTLCPHLRSVETLDVLTGRAIATAITGDYIHPDGSSDLIMARLTERETTRFMLGRELMVRLTHTTTRKDSDATKTG